MFGLLKPLVSDNTDDAKLITPNNTATDISQQHTSVHARILENKSTSSVNGNDVGGTYYKCCISIYNG